MMKSTLVVFFAILVAMVASQSAPFCQDWTVCMRVRCASPPDPCPANKPNLLYGECGCCQYCSKEPRIGPCGKCNVDVVCKEPDPICSEGQIVSLDYCGCCRVCMDVLEAGQNCTGGTEPYFSVCASELSCIDGTCQIPDSD
ncbi:uncharacterized protein LOC126736687 [Anthonomus grandis grandis]|uniref:uncharacterized protein LOC126736687 n=1 Tax=Anthonomus grandis grandis TaxID=2921223 RepID=UPI0021651A26|nr:uncharacterized protein LOC126736687 [Anthonomus grandis grandis]